MHSYLEGYSLLWLLFALITTVMGCRIMIRMNLADLPNERSSHHTPIPRGGGLAIAGGCLAGSPFLLQDISLGLACQCTLLGSFGMALLGFLDDLKPVKPIVRLIIQILLASITVTGGHLVLTSLSAGVPAFMMPQWIGFMIAVGWLVAYTNAFNFMDGLNGLSAGTALVTCLFLACLAYEREQDILFAVSILLAVSTAGFLPFNAPGARLFLGDSGSYFIGFTMAWSGLMLCTSGPRPISLWMLCILYFHYLFDTAFTLCRRFRRRKKLSQAHREHLYQLLQQTGLSHTQVSLIYCLMAGAQGGLVLYIQETSTIKQLFTLMVFVFIGLIYAQWVLQRARKRGIEL